MSKRGARGFVAGLLLALLAPVSQVAAQQVPSIALTVGGGSSPEQLVPSLKILAMLTVLTLAPAVLISMTSFTRIVVVLSFARQAMGTQSVPPTQIMISLSLLLTFVVMAPLGAKVNTAAIVPYTEKRIDEVQAWEAAKQPISEFLLAQTREDDLRLFYELSKTKLPSQPSEVAIHLLVPAFMISELRTGFEMGFLLFLPFALIDLVVASVLTAMGMMMLPPTTLSTPLKLLLFVAVDGWALLTRSLVASFQ
ncbi:MAG TPA: flagellar type III secretion system pore protein FliP [Polyangiales bacterium]|nr:flagellar type III secretion system pore protein FliP [Polyangiales bacterium]